MLSSILRGLMCVLLIGCVTSKPSAMITEPDASVIIEVGQSEKIMAATSSLVGRNILVVGDSEACAVNFVIKPTIQKINDENGHPRDVVSVDCKGSTTVRYWGEQGHLHTALSKHPHPDVVVVFLGTNHYAQMTGKVSGVDNVLQEIKKSGAQCVWVGNTAVRGKHWPINKILRDAVTPDCTYFDTEAANIPLADGIHPDRQASVKWLRLIWPMLPFKFEEKHDD